MTANVSVLVLGLGNALLSDDGVGVHVVRQLMEQFADELGSQGAVCCDGGTIGLALLGQIEDSASLIVVDAARFGEAPGTVALFEQERFDARVQSSRASAHDLALAELIDAARISGRLPERRALVAIEPASCEWGLSPTPAVAQAAPEAVALVRAWVGARGRPSASDVAGETA